MHNLYAGPTFQDSPELPEYPRFDLDIVSPELPCGVAWLANCCLELNIPLWKPWGLAIQDHWERRAPYQYRYIQPQTPIRQSLPALLAGQNFTFRTQPVPRLSHRWPLTLPDLNKTILFVRDPRDALYSQWQRLIRNQQLAADTPFRAFLAQPYFHYPFSYRDYLLLFLRLWQTVLADREHLILRFEDYKSAPQQTLQRALAFMQLDVTAAQLEQAVQRSDFSVVKYIEETFTGPGPKSLSNRSSLAYEYQIRYTVDMHDAMGAGFDAVYAWLGYRSHAEARQTVRATEPGPAQLDAMIAAMDATHLDAQTQQTLKQLYAQHTTDIALYR